MNQPDYTTRIVYKNSKTSVYGLITVRIPNCQPVDCSVYIDITNPNKPDPQFLIESQNVNVSVRSQLSDWLIENQTNICEDLVSRSGDFGTNEFNQ